MKRTPLKRGGNLERRTPLKAKTEIRRRKRVNAISARRRRDFVVLGAAIVELLERSGGRCEAVLLAHDCTGRADHPHHIQRRNRRNHAVDNLLHVCFTAHRMIHDDPDVAKELGYLRSSFERRLD